MTQLEPTITQLLDRLNVWLETQEFTPAIREITRTKLTPPSVYPHLLIVPLSEEFPLGQAAVNARCSLKLSAVAGRPRDALVIVRSLAHQVRIALNQSHGLGGLVKLVWLSKLDYSEAAEQTTGQVVVTASLELSARYCVTVR